MLLKIKKADKGFTLVELMIVIVIIALLIGIAIPTYMIQVNKAREASTETEMKNISTALETYFAELMEYPDTNEELTEFEEYLGYEFSIDTWGNSYSYESLDGTGYTIISNGIDGEENSDDDLVITDGIWTGTGAY